MTDPRKPVKSRRQVEYSSQPLGTINENALSDSRFLVPEARKFPYRDVMGRVNLPLCQRSLREADDLPADDAVRAKLVSWERHARHAIGSRPTDERMTLDELVEEAIEREAENEALPISRRKPRRAAAASPRQASDPAPRETIVVLRPDDKSAEQEEEGGRLVPGTVTMKRRLFRAPRPGDEPSPDTFYLRRIAESRRGRGLASCTPSDEDEDEDVYEVEAILKEDKDKDGTRFLIRWEGFGPESDTWEPEENVAPALVASFRRALTLRAANIGDDFMHGRKRMLWCGKCEEHRSADCFSANQRRAAPACRACLNHHYRIGAALAVSEVAGQLSLKRSRDERWEMGLASKRSVARSLSARQADLEVSNCRRFGLSLS